MSLFVTAERHVPAGCPREITVWAADTPMAVVVRFSSDDGAWHAAYGLNLNTQEIMTLPPCFGESMVVQAAMNHVEAEEADEG